MACDTGRGAAQSSAESVAQAGASSKQLTYRETRLSDTLARDRRSSQTLFTSRSRRIASHSTYILYFGL